MKKLILLLLIIPFTFANAQNEESNPKIVKAWQVFKKDMSKGIEKMQKIVDKERIDHNYDELIQMHFTKYIVEHRRVNSQSYDNELIAQLMQASVQITYNNMVRACLEAETYSKSVMSSMVLRNRYIDYNPDSNRTKEARKKYKKAEEWFNDENYETAAKYYKQTLDIDSNYYKALIYMGDCYWYIEKYDEAIASFRKGIEKYPDLLEPRKYLVDALRDAERYEEAIEEAIPTLFIYPDNSMFEKLEFLYEKQGKEMDRHWAQRGCTVNRLSITQETPKGAWGIYRSAKEEFEQYCDENGIVTEENDLSESKYLEVYSWEKMLKNSTELPADLKFAKKMMDEGYLDCHIFISQFSYNMYDQYKDFVENNKERVKEYISKYLIN